MIQCLWNTRNNPKLQNLILTYQTVGNSQEFLNTLSASEVGSDDSADVSSILVNNVCPNCKHPPRKERSLSGVRAAESLATVALSAREMIEISTGLPVYAVVARRSVTKLEKLELSATGTCTWCFSSVFYVLHLIQF